MPTADDDKPTVINTQIDPQIRAAMDAFMADYNGKNESKHTIRTCTEASLRGWLKSQGFWPWPPELPATAAAKPGRKRQEKAGAA